MTNLAKLQFRNEKKRILQIGKYKHKDLGWVWVIQGVYNKHLGGDSSVLWRQVELCESELTYLDSVHIDVWCEKIWLKDEIQRELEARAELKTALLNLFNNLN